MFLLLLLMFFLLLMFLLLMVMVITILLGDAGLCDGRDMLHSREGREIRREFDWKFSREEPAAKIKA
jgi:hypothetical protein